MDEHELLRRAALAVVRSVDHEASFYEAQSPVEDWALDALEAAILGNVSEAETLLGRYEHAEWEERRTYAIQDWDDGCRTSARAANAH
jgi:peptidyl-tRNA hydrolase